MVLNSLSIFHLILNRNLALRIALPKLFLVQSTMLMHPKPLAHRVFQPLSSRCVLHSFLLFLLSYTINAWTNLVFLPVGNLHRLCQFLKMLERSHPGKYCPISLLPNISKIFESFINDSLTKHLDITGLFSDLQYGFRAFRC